MKLHLIEKRKEAGNAWSFYFSPDKAIDWIAGQYLHYTLEHENPDAEGIKRFFTISSAPSEQRIQLTTRITDSTFKRALSLMNIGDEIEAGEPEGDFTWQGVDRPNIFIAGGIGITPYRSIFMDLHNKGEELPFRLLYGNRDDAYIFRAELEDLALAHPELEISYLTAVPIDLPTIQNLVPELLKSYVYYSGPEPMVEALGKELIGIGLSETQLKQDWFPGYDEKTL